MRMYKKKSDGKAGKWYIGLRDHTGTLRTFAAYTDKDISRTLGTQLEKLIAYRSTGRPLDEDITRWLEKLPPNMIRRLVEHNIIDRDIDIAAQPLMIANLIKRKRSSKEVYEVTDGHLADYLVHRQSREMGKQQSEQVISHCAKFFGARMLTYPTEITTGEIERHIADIRADGFSARTANAALAAINAFCNWMVKTKRMIENPASRISKLNEKTDRRLIRRALSKSQISALIDTTEKAEFYHGLTSHERVLIYRLALSTGLRWNEIYTLSIADFNLEEKYPSVTIRAENEKAGRGATLPLQPDLARDLNDYFSCKDTSSQLTLLGTITEEKAFEGMWLKRGADMLREDLDAAGIDWRENEAGEIIDFHSLRHTFGTLLAQSGVHPKTA